LQVSLHTLHVTVSRDVGNGEQWTATAVLNAYQEENLTALFNEAKGMLVEALWDPPF